MVQLNLTDISIINPISAIFNSLFGIIFGIILIIGWVPLVLFNEFTAKKNRSHILKFKTDLTNNIEKITLGTISATPVGLTTSAATTSAATTATGTTAAGTTAAGRISPGTMVITTFTETDENNNAIAVSVDFSEYIYLIQRIDQVITQPSTANSSTLNYLSAPPSKQNIISNGEIKFINNITKSEKIIGEPDLKSLSKQFKISSVKKINNNVSPPITTTTTYTYSGITQDAIIVDLSKIKEIAKSHGYKLNNYMYASSISDVINIIISTQQSSNTTIKWILRITSVLMLSSGLSLLISPIRIILQNSLFGIGKSILNLYDSLNLFASIILTIILTFIIYGLVNYTWQISIFITLLVGLIIFFQNKKKN